ncbi:hypothetical protein GE061_007143 [Apolygus lucorum]|uniref:CCHC-type domain-containing protein n=1 Tax=Apolygus lucorum TaxID=248454 RepID=A0A8S9WSP5_APOLU|nr:hypothetical protein GE061_007143 [Apolygus lucorum]
MDDVQRRTWIAARSVKAFLKGLPGQYAGFFVNNPPASLEEALKKAEQLEDALEPREADHWNVARIQTQEKRCFRCRELGHIASGCPNIPRPPTPPPQRRNAMGSPQKPCLYCGGRTHFPAHCLKNPKNFPCEYCGLYGHKESDCRVKLSHYADESMCDYCGYYGHLEAECPRRLKHVSRWKPTTGQSLVRIPASIHLDSCEVRMKHPKTGQSVVISEVITGYLAPARPVPMPDVAQPMRPRVAVVGSSDAFDPSHLLESADVDVLASNDCPILDPSEEFPTEDLDKPIPDLLENRDNHRIQITGVPDDACITPPIAPMPDKRPEPVPCNWEMDDLVPDEDTYPVARFHENQDSKELMETSPVTTPEAEKSTETRTAEEKATPRQLRNLPRKDYRQLHTGKSSK